jgi:Ni/Co efflux regulator RcnB
MKKLLLKILISFILALLLAGPVEAQQRKASMAQKKKEQVERNYKKAYAKARKRTIKHRREIQTEATKKMMDEADNRAETFNKLNDPTFFERYFKRKRPGRR